MLNLLHTDTSTVSRETLRWAPIEAIDDNPYQTRQNYKPVHLLRLAASIASMRHELPGTLGLQQPPVARLVAPNGCGVDAGLIGDLGGADELRALLADGYRLQLAFGHSRLRAWRMLAMGVNGMTGIRVVPDDIREAVGTEDWPHLASNDYQAMPVMLVALKDDQMWRQAVSENAQRQDITAIEQALALRVAVEDLGMSVTGAAATFGWSRSTASNKLRLLQLPLVVQQAVASGRWTERHGRAVLPLLAVDGRETERLIELLLGEQEMTVAEMETRVKGFLNRYPLVRSWLETDVLDMPGADQVERKPEIVGRCVGCQFLLTLPDGASRCAQPMPPEVARVASWNYDSCFRLKNIMAQDINAKLAAKLKAAEAAQRQRLEALQPAAETQAQNTLTFDPYEAKRQRLEAMNPTKIETLAVRPIGIGQSAIQAAHHHMPQVSGARGPVTRVATAMADGSVVEVAEDTPQLAPPGHALYVHPAVLERAVTHLAGLLLESQEIDTAIAAGTANRQMWKQLTTMLDSCREGLRRRGHDEK